MVNDEDTGVMDVHILLPSLSWMEDLNNVPQSVKLYMSRESRKVVNRQYETKSESSILESNVCPSDTS